MKDTYDWRYDLDKNFNFLEGLIPCLNKMFRDRRKKAGQTFGSATKKLVLKGSTNTNDP